MKSRMKERGGEREGRRGRAHRFNGVFNCDVLPVVLDVEGGAEEVAEAVERKKYQSLRCCWHRITGEKEIEKEQAIGQQRDFLDL